LCYWGLTVARGYVKLWRKSLDGNWLKNHKTWAFWSWCLLKASHKKHKQIVGFQEIELNPGEFIFGRKAAANELGLSQQSTRTILKFLKKSKNLTIKSTNKFSIISITNWGSYQSDEDQTNHQTNKRLTSNQPATNQQLTTNKNGKNDKKGKNKEKKEIKKERFIPPTNQDISNYCQEQNLKFDIDGLMDHYQSNGWMVGKNKMKDWKAAVRNWARRDKVKNNKSELKARNFQQEYNIQSGKAFLERRGHEL